MASEEILISGIEYKVRKLVEVNNFLKIENQRLSSENHEAKKKINELNTEIENNKKEIFKFTLANSLEINFGVDEGKQRINSLIDEIDKCIEILSG